MGIYVDPRTGSLRDVIIWIVEELKKLKAQVYKLSQGGSGGTQDLQSVLNNGTYAENLDNPNSFVDFLNGDNISLVLSNGDWRSRLSMSNNEIDGNIALSSNTLSSGVYGQIELNAGKILLFETVDDNSEFFRKTTTVKFETPIALAEDGAATILIPAKPVGSYILMVKEDFLTELETTRTKGVTTINLDGVASVYTIPHGLGQVPSFAFAGRGSSTNFDVFNTTWDATNIIITYENPPIAGTLDINWIALK